MGENNIIKSFMEEPKFPKLSNSKIGFGIYGQLNIQTIYTGTGDIPHQLFQSWFKKLLHYETTPNSFKCSDLQDLLMVLESVDGKLIGRQLMQKSIETSFYKQVANNTYRYYPNNTGADVNLEDKSILIDYYTYWGAEESHGFNKDLFESNLQNPMTEANCGFLKFEFVKNYIIVSCDEEIDLNSYGTKIETIISDVIEKYFNKTHWFLEANNPALFDLHTINPAYNSENNRFVLAYGAPSYLDWLMRNGKIYLRPETITKLEALEVNLKRLK